MWQLQDAPVEEAHVFALWHTNRSATLLLMCALMAQFPFVAYMSRVEGRSYSERAKQERYADYYAQQLVYQRTATELNAMATGARMASWTRARYDRATSIYLKSMSTSLMCSIGAGLATATLVAAALAVLVLSPGASSGDLAAGVVAILSSSVSVFYAGMALGDAASATIPAASIFAFLDRAHDRTPVQVHRHDVAVLELRDLGATYPHSNRPAVQDVNITVCKGEIVALVGLNGAGKTTLVSCIAGLVRPTQGAAQVDGVDVLALSP